ncbi:hypothetical protein CspeluHIS016_0600950 [Cutaneotrichosporon spelunceum]|uniref:Uncharacterized protein n=1 Tax=Cutaneotrichosporon spelunceum TaxID=1672016 RepID=A0AAD3TXN7_9TREE|nr:hypothetical protein CspeluHIS016_0600950 [Cutaneotrichosporon spelunceum]
MRSLLHLITLTVLVTLGMFGSCPDQKCRQAQCLQKCNPQSATCAWFYSCVDGYCQCPIGQTLCYRQIAWFECADLNTYPGHCGACWNRCDTGFACVNGKCTSQCNGNQKVCGNMCVNILNDNNNCGQCVKKCHVGSNCCSVGKNCVGGECR